jgi:hypothetical protein
MQEAVLTYNREYLVEPARGCLKGQPLLPTPMPLERVVILRRLASERMALAGLYIHNPQRMRAHLTPGRLLRMGNEYN